jgi:alkanesulfonate monooxygenase SsuD/methylene tetrahydromethanopterin reductase-like flavin-dependent oxidoreductase (luciferase family)
VPLDFIDQTSLIGPRDRVKDRLGRYAASGVTTLTIAAEGVSLEERLHVVRSMAELLDESGLAD